MNILVVGNGFDLAHNLPTSYKDFLHFTDVFVEFKTQRRVLGVQIPVENNQNEKHLINYLMNLFNDAETTPDAKCLIEEIDSLITDNKWIEHFKNVNIANGWIDFENEISLVIRTFDKIRIRLVNELQTSGKGISITPYQSSIIKPFIGEAALFTSTVTIDKLNTILLNDLNKLTRCLEIYLSDYISSIAIENTLPDIAELDIHAVVSFNYTDTYRMNYLTTSNNVECDFIHGRAQLTNSLETCNMIIGIDEYLEGADKETDTEYIQYKKFFQRIYKATGCNYIDWLENFKPRLLEGYSPDESNIYIYGHSLDATDKDILKALITAENSKTTIFYHSQEALKKQIINLVKVITEDELIRRTGDKKIIFQKTKES